uniref:Histone-lysine N-methyltransferase n=3 Tax=Oryza sativa subsp. japonica TaxID=39947 RepID=Q6ZJS9_ORYSJ|nr:putative histone-lysine N-methyltransferase [Oryza sativa Japonica Group]
MACWMMCVTANLVRVFWAWWWWWWWWGDLQGGWRRGMDRWEALIAAAARRSEPPRSGWAEWGGGGDARAGAAALPSRCPRRPVAAAGGRGEGGDRMRGRGGEEGTWTAHGGGGRGAERAGAVVAPTRTADAAGTGTGRNAVAVGGGAAEDGRRTPSVSVRHVLCLGFVECLGCVTVNLVLFVCSVVVIVSGRRSVGEPTLDVSEMLLQAAQAWRSRRTQREARPDALPPRHPPRPVAADGRGGSGEGTSRARGRGEEGTARGGDGEMMALVRTVDVAVAGGLATLTHGGERDAGAAVATEEKRNGGEVGTKRGMEERAARSPPPPKRSAVSSVRQLPPGCGRDAALPLGRRHGRGRDGDGGVPPLAGNRTDLPLEAVVDGGDPIANVHQIFSKSSHATDENQVACKVGSLEDVVQEGAANSGELLGWKQVLAQAANVLPKRRMVSATRRFPPGCGRDVKTGSGLEFMAVDASCGGVSKEVVASDGGDSLVSQELEEGEVADEAYSDVDSQNVAVDDSMAAATEDVKVMNKCKGTLPRAAAEPCAEGPSKEHFKGTRECENDRMGKSSMNVATEVFGDGMMRSKILLTARKAVKSPLNTLHRWPFSKGKEECAVTNSAPFGPKKKFKVKGAYQTKDIPIKIVSTPGLGGKDNLVDKEALILEDDDILKALAVHDGKLKLYLNASSSVQRHGQHGSGNANDRRKTMMLCRRFQFIHRALVHAVKQGSLKVLRADLEADKIVRKLPGFIKPGPIVGNVRGVEVGDEFLYRVELALVGLHRPYQGGIDTTDHNGVLVAISIVASGGYPDRLSSSGELIYTGSGGQPAGKKKGEDQKLERGNLALKNCIKTKTPVRVIHGFKGQNGKDDSYSRAKQISAFTYDGLYRVVDYWREGLKGSMVFKYRLQRIHAGR